MPITVAMIEDKEFKTKVRGYDPVEVDEFLDEICDELDTREAKIKELTEQLARKEAAPAFVPPVAVVAPAPAPLSPTPAPHKPVLPVDVESAQLLLAKTQKACDETLAEAKKRAEAIIEAAEEEAASILPDPELSKLEEQREAVRGEIARLTGELNAVRGKFRSFLESQSDLLNGDLSK